MQADSGRGPTLAEGHFTRRVPTATRRQDRAALVQDAGGLWGSAAGGYEIAVIDPSASTQEIEVPGAWDMSAIQSLTVSDYTPPDFPALGSVALD